MIMVTAKTQNGTHEVDFLVNRGGWFGETWLVQVGNGYSTCNVVIEADNEQDAIDELADSKRSYLIDGEQCDVCKNASSEDDSYSDCYCNTAGNDSHYVNLDNVSISKCKVNYFAAA